MRLVYRRATSWSSVYSRPQATGHLPTLGKIIVGMYILLTLDNFHISPT